MITTVICNFCECRRDERLFFLAGPGQSFICDVCVDECALFIQNLRLKNQLDNANLIQFPIERREKDILGGEPESA